MAPEEFIGLVMGISRGILANRKLRRTVMVGFLIAAGSLCLLGVTLFSGYLDSRLIPLFLYWAFCLGLVFLAVLFAFYDMAKLREEHRSQLKQLDKRLARAVAEPLDSEAVDDEK